MSAPRYRPPKTVFEALCRHYTQREIAEICGVTRQAVSEWQKEYDCRPRTVKPGPKTTSASPFRAALDQGLRAPRVD